MLRYEICFHPSWWHRYAGIDFSESFWNDPQTRIQSDIKMRKELYRRFGNFGLGEENPEPRPIVGCDNTACGYLFSQMLGCKVIYAADHSPQVVCAELDDEASFALKVPNFNESPEWMTIERQLEALKSEYGYALPQINLMGVQNIAMDLRGQDLFMDYYDEESPARHLLEVACETMLEAGRRLRKYSPYLSAGVTNILRHVRPENFCTSNCTVEMVSREIYENFLLEYDNRLADEFTDFGIHHCGATMEHVVEGYAKVHHLKFVEAGAFSDLRAVRDALPDDIQINARYSPARLAIVSKEALRQEIEEMTKIVPGERLSISCVGIDSNVPEEKIRWFLEDCMELLPIDGQAKINGREKQTNEEIDLGCDRRRQCQLDARPHAGCLSD